MPSRKILFVFTSADKFLSTGGKPIGWFLPEAAHPYYVLSSKFTIDFASPLGPNPPIDESSVKNFTDDDSVKFLKDETVTHKLSNCKLLNDVKVEEYEAVFYVGGHGPVVDLAIDPVNVKVASDFWRSGKIVSAVCHGPAALVGATDTSGKSIFSGQKVTAFSNAEEEKSGFTKDVPFLVEDRIKELGGTFEKADELFGVKVVVSGKLLTGQNPASSKALGKLFSKL